MNFFNRKNIDKVWANICKHEGEIFYKVRNIPYNYIVKNSYILINSDSRRRVSKIAIEKTLKIKNPTPSKLNVRCQSYIYGIITDSRIT